MSNGKNRCHGFNDSCGTQTMAYHRLDRANRDRIGLLSKDFLDGEGFDLIIQRSTCPVGIDIIYF